MNEWKRFTQKAILEYVRKLEKENARLSVELDRSKLTPIDRAMAENIEHMAKEMEQALYGDGSQLPICGTPTQEIPPYENTYGGKRDSAAQKIRAKANKMRARKAKK